MWVEVTANASTLIENIEASRATHQLTFEPPNQWRCQVTILHLLFYVVLFALLLEILRVVLKKHD